MALRTSELMASPKVSANARRKVSEVSCVDVCDEAPAVWEKRLNFQLLLVAALFFDECGVVRAGELKPAVNDAEVGVFDGGVFERPGAKFGALGGAAFGEQFGAHGGVQPGFRRPSKRHRPKRSP